MDPGHLHLMINHLPVIGVPALLTLLSWGLVRGVPTITRAALWLTLTLRAVTLVVYFTGESAEELVEGLPTFEERWVERHEAVALGATVAVVVSGLLAAAALYRRALAWLVVVGLAVSTVALGATAWTGGPIGHPELRPAGAAEMVKDSS